MKQVGEYVGQQIDGLQKRVEKFKLVHLADYQKQLNQKITQAVNTAGSLAQHFAEKIPEVKNLPDEILRECFSDLEETMNQRIKCESCAEAQCDYGVRYSILVNSPDYIVPVYAEKMFGICKPIAVREKMAQIQRYFNQSHLGRRFTQRRFENFDRNSHTAKAFQQCKDYAENINEHLKDGQGLLLAGPVGTGKTHLAAAIVHEVIEKHVIPAAFVTVPDLLARIKATFGNGHNEETQEELINLVRSADLLVLDDMGVEKPTDWVREQLYIILDSRYEDLKPTIITTNCSLEEMEERIGARTVSRIIEMCDGVMVDGTDYRKRRLT